MVDKHAALLNHLLSAPVRQHCRASSLKSALVLIWKQYALKTYTDVKLGQDQSFWFAWLSPNPQAFAVVLFLLLL